MRRRTSQPRCPACGIEHSDESAHCTHCGANVHSPTWRQYKPASLPSRLLPALIDHVLFALVFSLARPLLLSLLQDLLPQLQPVLGQALLQLVSYLGFFFLLTWLAGTTPGKWLFGITLRDAQTGKALGFWRAWIREVPGRFVCMILLSPIGFVTVQALHARAQTVADLMAGTVVLKKRKRS